MSSDPFSTRRFNRFHGRVESDRPCAVPGCPEPGEFRAPLQDGHRSHHEGPQWRWLCLDHVRAFNQGYNFFTGMTPDEIHAAAVREIARGRDLPGFMMGTAVIPFGTPTENVLAVRQACREAGVPVEVVPGVRLTQFASAVTPALLRKSSGTAIIAGSSCELSPST